jgi:hypothetical protein
MNRLRRRKATLAELRVEQLRRARVAAPTLRALVPAAASVAVELMFDVDTRLARNLRTFTVYPPAQAHFVYACAFGDCDGTHDLGEEIFGMLHAGLSLGTGVRHCPGHRGHRGGHGSRCELRVTYTVTVRYGMERIGAAMQPALT